MSKSAMIITIGTRDLQLKSSIPEETLEKINTMPVNNNPDCLYLSSARDDGKNILENFSEFKDHLIYPIIKPGIEKVIRDTSNIIDTILLVSTDQDDSVDNNFKRNDTLYVSECIKQLIDKDYSKQKGKVKHLRITKNVIDYDSMYDFFDDKFNGSFFNDLKPDETSLYILPQGGIDSVNHTLLLKAIENYPKTFQLSMPERSSIAYLQKFPEKFRKNIIKHKIIHALENYNYASIPDFEYSTTVTALSKYALSLVSLDYENAKTTLQILLDDDNNREQFMRLVADVEDLIENYELRLTEVYITAKIKLKQGLYSDFLIKIFTLAENILKPEIKKHLGDSVGYSRMNNHSDWNKLLSKHSDLIKYLESCKINNSPLEFKKPNRCVFKEIYDFFNRDQSCEKKQLFEELYIIISNLSGLRNKVAHEIIGISQNAIDERLKNGNKSNLDEFIELADEYFEIDKERPFGRFEEINNIINNVL